MPPFMVYAETISLKRLQILSTLTGTWLRTTVNVQSLCFHDVITLMMKAVCYCDQFFASCNTTPKLKIYFR